MESQSQDVSLPRTRTLHACDNCRSLKARCFPSEQTGTCIRCLKGKKECNFSEQQPRRARRRMSRTRVAKMESKIDGLIALLDQSQKRPDLSSTPSQDHGQTTTPSTFNEGTGLGQVTPQSLAPPLRDYQGAFHEDSTTFINTFEGSDDYVDEMTVSQKLFVRGILDYNKAQKLLWSFRDMTLYFPFIILPADATVESMSEQSPFLFLAVLAVTSSAEKPLQKTLSEELRNALSSKVLIDGERSIDILQGLLVYLAWYQFFCIPRIEQSYQFLQIAIGMVVDLGLDQKPWDARAQKRGLDLSHYDDESEDNSSNEFFSRKARRCYLGCYYLSTAIAIRAKKPSNLRFSEYMIQCCISLKEEMESPSDMLLLYIIQMQRMGEEVHDAYHLKKLGNHEELEQLRLQTAVKSFKSQLESWKVSLPVEIERSSLIEMNYHILNANIHEMGLILRASQPTRPRNTCVPTSSALSPLVTNLFTCLSAVKSYFETFLSLSPLTYRHVSFNMWTHLIYATFVLYKLSLGLINVQEWDPQIAREIVKLEIYLESLCFRLQNIGLEAHPGNPLKLDLFSMFRLLLENVKATYLKLKGEQNPDIEGTTPHAAFSELKKNEMKAKRSACPAFPYLRKEAFQGSGNGDGMFGASWFATPDFPDNADFWDGIMAAEPFLEADIPPMDI